MTNAPALPAAAEHLIEAALESSDGSRLWVADAIWSMPIGSTWTHYAPDDLLTLTWQHRYDLAVALLPAIWPRSRAYHLLSSLRDLHARQVLAFVPSEAYGMVNADLLALGLQLQARFHHQELILEAWSFDIRTYKAVPDWLNPRFWANPEQWNKFRW